MSMKSERFVEFMKRLDEDEVIVGKGINQSENSNREDFSHFAKFQQQQSDEIELLENMYSAPAMKKTTAIKDAAPSPI